ncbi:RHS repeat-associated core domain-containing protein [Pseudomonas caspiana]|uniref:RHS repeat-associated core domain-containing protein n=1 Tax=Pseudomonas caspiana TaxID=1451454 RepID=UPI0032EBAF31
MTSAQYAHTPTLAVFDPRCLTLGNLAYCRSDDQHLPDLRASLHHYNSAGRRIASQDPRLSSPNLRMVYSLSGQVLLTESVDAGWRLALLGEAGQSLEGWDGRGSVRQAAYDDMLRPVLIMESTAAITTESSGTGFSREEASTPAEDVSSEIPPSRLKPLLLANMEAAAINLTSSQNLPDQVVERFTYGGPDAAEHNQCNQLTRHDDTAGTLYRPDYGLSGSPLTEVRHFLRELEMPDWPLAIAERDDLLEADGLESNWSFDALGEVIEQTDAMGNTRQFKHTIAGQLKSVSLDGQVLLSEIRYNAFDQVAQETAGNGVISRSTYDPQNGRLTELSAALPDAPPLQHLKYGYDPVGNIDQIEDAAQPVRFFANQRIEPINQYRYDTLYQLIEATGREVKTGASHGPALPDLQNLLPDANQIANYTQSYEYDAGGNLLEMRHVGAQLFTRTMRVALDSNRSLPANEADVEIDDGFDANGNLLQLVRGQSLSWDARNQLYEVTAVKRDDGPDDKELYIYDGNGQRCRKVRSSQTSTRTLIGEVRYLHGLEIRSEPDDEILHVITVQAGRNSVRVLHWTSTPPSRSANDQVRYNLSDHLGSSTLELDHQGGLISQEGYYPFGGSAWWAARSASEAKYKAVRYSGKERDASGLYYYGFRYYAPWLQRWLNPDPTHDGLNAFQMVNNNPVNLFDREGLAGELATSRWKMAYRGVKAQGVRVRTVARGIIAVDISGGNELFNRMGVGLDRDIRGDRALSYLSLDASLQGKIAGGKRMVNLNRSDGGNIKSVARLKGAGAVAYINGGFFNMDGAADFDKPEHASIGPNVIDGKRRERVDVPQGYGSFYEKVRMQDGSMIHAAPKLSRGGQATFTEAMLSDKRFQFSAANNAPGVLGHAQHPNARSGMSRPQENGADSRTRLAMGSSNGRVDYSPGYTMPEWAKVMARLDRLNSSESSSVNLDGGGSVSLGVIGAGGESLMARSPLRSMNKEIGNFIAFSEPVGFFRRLFNR